MPKTKSSWARILPATLPALLLSGVALIGCQGGNASKIEETLNQIAEKQDTIVSKLDALEEKVKGGAAGQKPPQPAGPDPAATYKVPLGDAYAKGPNDAKVTIIEWSDFQCPFCKRVGPTIKQIEDQYKGEVRVAFKHNPLPFHNRALPAALASEAAGRQGKFWEMHDKLFDNQKDLTDENFEKWAKELGLDVEKFKKDLADAEIKKKVEEQQKEGNNLGARGTPAFFINGRFLSGAQPVESFKKVIDEEIGKVDKIIAAGTPKDKAYDEVIKNGKTKP